MKKQGLERYAPLAGLVFVAVLVAAIIIAPDGPPDPKDSAAKVVAFWSKHDTGQITSSILGVYAMGALIWFAGSVRGAISKVEAGSARLATLSFAGAVVLALGMLINLGFTFMAADTVNDVPPQVTQTLSVVANGLWFPMALGVGLMLGSAGIAALRHGWLPMWAGWVTLAIGVLAVTPVGFFALLAAAIWVAVISVVLFRRESAAVAATPATTPPAAPAAGMAG